MVIDGWHLNIVERRQHFLRQPYVFILIAHFKTPLTVACRGNERQILRGAIADGYFVFLLSCHILNLPLFASASSPMKTEIRVETIQLNHAFLPEGV